MKNALQCIRAFVTVAQTGHFAKAAAQLHLSPSALTVQVQQLEHWLGVALLDRGPRHLELTEAGRQNLVHMETLLLDLDNLVATNRDLAALKRGVVELAALPSLCAGLLPVVLKHFADLHPGVEVRLRDVVAQQVEDQVRAGSVDFGLSVAPRSAGGLRFQPLLVDRICLLLPLDHPLNDGRTVTLADLDDQPMILTGRDSSVRMQVERLFEDRRLTLRRQIEANYMSTAIALVQQGLGMTLLPESAVQGHETLACIRLEEPALNRCIGIITRGERTLGPAAEVLAALLATQAGA
jgi:LysR family carnitine catabolism transcriptional activator